MDEDEEDLVMECDSNGDELQLIHLNIPVFIKAVKVTHRSPSSLGLECAAASGPRLEHRGRNKGYPLRRKNGSSTFQLCGTLLDIWKWSSPVTVWMWEPGTTCLFNIAFGVSWRAFRVYEYLLLGILTVWTNRKDQKQIWQKNQPRALHDIGKHFVLYFP